MTLNTLAYACLQASKNNVNTNKIIQTDLFFIHTPPPLLLLALRPQAVGAAQPAMLWRMSLDQHFDINDPFAKREQQINIPFRWIKNIIELANLTFLSSSLHLRCLTCLNTSFEWIDRILFVDNEVMVLFHEHKAVADDLNPPSINSIFNTIRGAVSSNDWNRQQKRRYSRSP